MERPSNYDKMPGNTDMGAFEFEASPHAKEAITQMDQAAYREHLEEMPLAELYEQLFELKFWLADKAERDPDVLQNPTLAFTLAKNDAAIIEGVIAEKPPYEQP